MIGKPGEPISRISQAHADRVEVRGRDLTGDLMGRLTFTEYFHLLLTGDEPTGEQRYFLDLLLVAIAEHGGDVVADVAALVDAVEDHRLHHRDHARGECAQLPDDASLVARGAWVHHEGEQLVGERVLVDREPEQRRHAPQRTVRGP